MTVMECRGVTIEVHAEDCKDRQARFLVRGFDDVLWTEDHQEVLQYVGEMITPEHQNAVRRLIKPLGRMVQDVSKDAVFHLPVPGGPLGFSLIDRTAGEDLLANTYVATDPTTGKVRRVVQAQGWDFLNEEPK